MRDHVVLLAAAVLTLVLGGQVLAGSNPLNTAGGDTPASAAEPEANQDATSGEASGEVQSFVDGNLHFIAYHELGHAFVSEFGLPVLGREEDAVDRLAIWMMTPEAGEEEPEYLTVAIEGWFASAEDRALDDIAWWGEHGTDEQRAYQIACLLYGWNPELYKTIADDAELPEEWRVACESEAKSNDMAWTAMLEPHTPEEGVARATGSVKVVYGDTATFAEELLYLKDLGLLDHIAELIETQYMFKPGITVTAGECGQPNAFWNRDERKLTMCYELVDYFQQKAKDLKL